MGIEYEAKRCRTCKVIHPISNFNKSKGSSDSLMAICRTCYNKKIRNKYDPVKKKAQHLKYMYGITREEYDEKLERQGNGCAICGIKIPGGNGQHFYVDHNHVTGQVRDLLCHNCNFVIGYAKEDIEILRAVARYLDVWSNH